MILYFTWRVLSFTSNLKLCNSDKARNGVMFGYFSFSDKFNFLQSQDKFLSQFVCKKRFSTYFHLKYVYICWKMFTVYTNNYKKSLYKHLYLYTQSVKLTRVCNDKINYFCLIYLSLHSLTYLINLWHVR